MAISIKTNLVNRAYEFLYIFYYRFIFGRRTSLEERSKALVHSWEQQRGKGDIPTSKEVWETQYSKGHWDFLGQVDELAHYSILVGHIQYLKPSGSILDIGCGKGILQQKLAPYGYSRYVGIDISDDAIRQASGREDDKTAFMTGDATHYSPGEAFDVIIFNEVLYSFDEPLKIVERFERYLQRTGIFIVSLYLTERAAAIERRLQSLYLSIDTVRIINKSKTWICNVFVPRENRDG